MRPELNKMGFFASEPGGPEEGGVGQTGIRGPLAPRPRASRGAPLSQRPCYEPGKTRRTEREGGKIWYWVVALLQYTADQRQRRP